MNCSLVFEGLDLVVAGGKKQKQLLGDGYPVVQACWMALDVGSCDCLSSWNAGDQ
jgi:hypothetical protein